MSYAAYHPGETVASANDVFSSLSIPIDALGAHLRIPAKLNSHSGQREHPDP